MCYIAFLAYDGDGSGGELCVRSDSTTHAHRFLTSSDGSVGPAVCVDETFFARTCHLSWARACMHVNHTNMLARIACIARLECLWDALRACVQTYLLFYMCTCPLACTPTLVRACSCVDVQRYACARVRVRVPVLCLRS